MDVSENVFPVDTPFQVKVYKTQIRRTCGEIDLIGKATVVGAYLRPYWHPYMYSAYHVVYEDGRKDTVYADHCKGVS